MTRKRPTWTPADIARSAPEQASRKYLAVPLDLDTVAYLYGMAVMAGMPVADLAASMIRAIVEDDAAAHEGGV